MTRLLIGAALLMLTCSASAAPRPDQLSPEQEITRLEHEWGAACKARNKAFLQQLYATEYLLTDYDGATYTKEQDIARIMAADMSRVTFALGDLRVRVYGAVAIVTGLNTVTEAGKSRSYRMTDAFVKRDGRWQIVATQNTRKQ